MAGPSRIQAATAALVERLRERSNGDLAIDRREAFPRTEVRPTTINYRRTNLGGSASTTFVRTPAAETGERSIAPYSPHLGAVPPQASPQSTPPPEPSTKWSWRTIATNIRDMATTVIRKRFGSF